MPVFDPREVPVLGTDAHLPAVGPADRLIPTLLRAFTHPPEWTPELRFEADFSQRHVVPASVLIGVVGRERPTVLLTRRAQVMTHHAGQIAFPGGRIDAADADAVAAALREAEEEVGLRRQQVRVLGQLPTYRTGSAFLITPVVALVDPQHVLQINPSEVQDVFEVPLDFLMNPANHQRQSLHWSGAHREWFSMPYASEHGEHGEHFIWGATAGLLRNLYRLMSAAMMKA